MKRLILGCALVVMTAVVGASAGCLDGDYEVVGDPLLPSPAGALASDIVTIAGDTIPIASGCSAARFRSRPTRRGTVVRAVWLQCGAVRRVRLRALVNGTCRVMRGLFVTGRPRSLRRFVAQHEIACPPGESGCRLCRANDDCSDDSFCAREAGQCSGLGICEQRPARCPLAFVRVCGCDGATYAGPCEAAQHGVNVAHAGSCDTRCGGIAGLPCAEGRYCELPAGMCDAADLEGTCVDIPEVCPELYAPVCGCDGVTYSTECERQAVGAQKAHDGPCGHECATRCDCYASMKLPDWCAALACPACGCVWQCDQGSCAVRVETPPQPPDCDATMGGRSVQPLAEW